MLQRNFFRKAEKLYEHYIILYSTPIPYVLRELNKKVIPQIHIHEQLIVRCNFQLLQ